MLLIGVPIVFNVAFLEAGRTFDDPAILRTDPGDVLRRFGAGGSELLLRCELLLLSALAVPPLSVLVAASLRASAELGIVLIIAGAPSPR